jgi:hypothetical protein
VNRGPYLFFVKVTKTNVSLIILFAQEFSSDFVVRLVVEGFGVPPMTIQIEGASVIGGTAGAVFDNNAGVLTVNNLQVSDVTTAALIATGNNGASFLEDSTIESRCPVAKVKVV